MSYCPLRGEWGRNHIRQLDQAPLGFGDNLLRDNEDVSRRERFAGAKGGAHDLRREVVASLNFRQIAKPDQLEFHVMAREFLSSS